MTTAITTRAGKGSGLTTGEIDANFTSLNANKLEAGNNLSDVTNVAQAQANLQVDPAGTAVAMCVALS